MRPSKLLVEHYRLAQDSGGAGRHRGGLGIDRTVRARTPMTVNTQVDRAHCKPWGLEGGRDGAGNQVSIRLGGKWKEDFPSQPKRGGYVLPIHAIAPTRHHRNIPASRSLILVPSDLASLLFNLRSQIVAIRVKFLIGNTALGSL